MKETEKIKGDDGISRTLREWEKFINERLRAIAAPTEAAHHKGFYKLHASLAVLSNDKLTEDSIAQAGKCAGDYVMAAIREARKLPTNQAKLDSLYNAVIALGKSIETKPKYNKNNVKMGLILKRYIKMKGDAPRSRKALRDFMVDELCVSCNFKHSAQWSEALEFYSMKTVCRDRHTG